MSGKRFFFFGETQAGVGWEKHAWQVHQEGVNREGADQTPTEAQVTYNDRGERVARVRHRDAAIGLDSQDVHMAGDRCVTTAEIPDGKGGVTQYVERYDDAGKFSGSYEVRWEKTGPRTHTLASKRRVYY